MIMLEQAASVIMTDSGGVQKEAYWLSVPCVTLRNETERVETLETGWNRLAGTEPNDLFKPLMNVFPHRTIPHFTVMGKLHITTFYSS